MIVSYVRQFEKLDLLLQDEVSEKIELLKHRSNHRALKAHKLHGQLKDCYSFSVNYRFRVVYEYLSQDEVVLLAIGDHEVYR